jgi:hypothetical protein
VKPALPSSPSLSSRPAGISPLGRALRAAITLFLVILAGGVIAVPAQAAAFRYWGYFQLTNGAWAFAQTGPAQAVPKDGSVEGWRFAVADESSTRNPRATPTFETLCASTPVTTGNKRVGLVIDYGRPADAAEATPAPPALRATCVAVPEKATGSDVLVAAKATLRLDPKGLTCAIDGWPATGCGGPVDPVPAAAASPDTIVTIAAPAPSASATPLAKSADTSADTGQSSRGVILGGLAAVVVVGALGFAAWRRSRDAAED